MHTCERSSLPFRIIDGIVRLGHGPEQSQSASIFITTVFVERHGQMVNDSAELLLHLVRPFFEALKFTYAKPNMDSQDAGKINLTLIGGRLQNGGIARFHCGLLVRSSLAILPL